LPRHFIIFAPKRRASWTALGIFTTSLLDMADEKDMHSFDGRVEAGYLEPVGKCHFLSLRGAKRRGNLL